MVTTQYVFHVIFLLPITIAVKSLYHLVNTTKMKILALKGPFYIQKIKKGSKNYGKNQN
ncbi:hypothetical protein CLOSTHATH_07393, partial [Hungatella hathewayi DSM 13479]